MGRNRVFEAETITINIDWFHWELSQVFPRLVVDEIYEGRGYFLLRDDSTCSIAELKENKEYGGIRWRCTYGKGL